MAQTHNSSKQRGFTLVEIAIVLVIVGLVLGGVLKGQEMIRGAKVKNVNNDAQNIISAVSTYKDRYNVMPGDDSLSTIAVASGVTGDGNGQLESDENGAFWAQLRQAGLMKGTGNLSPTHSFGGTIQVRQNPYTNAQGSFVCFINMPGDVADIVDRQFDDGTANRGAIQSSDDPTYVVDGTATYDLCYRL
jgi:prepilin-type N-terminal cleavage/methylation domain